MDKDHIVAIAARGEAIKTNSTEFLWVCRGIKPPVLPPDKPLPSDAAVSPLQPQRRPLNSGGEAFSHWDRKVLSPVNYEFAKTS